MIQNIPADPWLRNKEKDVGLVKAQISLRRCEVTGNRLVRSGTNVPQWAVRDVDGDRSSSLELFQPQGWNR